MKIHMPVAWTHLIIAFGLALAVPLAMICWRVSSQATPPAPAVAPDSLVPEDVRALLADFRSSDWTTVHRAEEGLVSQQKIAIPALIALLDADVPAPLTNTADLIYPGAKAFYGHGYFVDYDLDYLPARAGWALEDLTFCDFGFREDRILERRLPKSVKSGKVKVTLAIVDPATLGPKRRRERLEPAIAAARAWWVKNQEKWTRLAAIRENLRGDDAQQQSTTLQWFLHGTTKCDGLSLDSYTREIRPIVVALSRSENESVRTQAERLLADSEAYWWRMKTDPDWYRR